MRHALGVAEIRGRVVHDQVVSVHCLAYGPIAQRAVVDLFERRAAETQHEQHAVSVGVILRGRGGQVMVQVAL